MIGAGAFGRNHVRVLSQMPDVELVAVVDLDFGKAQQLAAEYKTQAFADIPQGIDAAVVATPTVTHEIVTEGLLASGVDVLVEKPIADDALVGERLTELARENGRILQVGHLERFNPAVAALSKVVTVPLFFEVHRLSVFTPRSLDVDVVLDLMIHDLDIVLQIMGEMPIEIRAAGISVLSQRVDIANVRLAFAGGCVANLTASRVSTEQVRKLRLFQPGEYISIDYKRQDAVRLRILPNELESGFVSSFSPQIGFEQLPVERGEPLQLELEAFVRAVRDRTPPLVRWRSGDPGAAFGGRNSCYDQRTRTAGLRDDRAKRQVQVSSSAVSLPPSDVELNLLLEWPNQRTRPQWILICAGSLFFHLVVFYLGTRLQSLVGQRQPERQVVVHRIPLYLPPDLMTQKAPNRAKLSKQIDLADLLASQQAKASPKLPAPSVRRFELPKQMAKQLVAKNATPQILPQAPAIALNQNPVISGTLPGALPSPAPPPPKPSTGPFLNIDEAAPPNPHPKLAPPKNGVQSAIEAAAQDSKSRDLSVSDDVPEQLTPLRPGGMGQTPAQHAAVELQSDPNGADFKNYLRNILTIVRANWRRVIPESARMGMLRGRTVVEFVIDRNGSIPKLVTADSSGSEPLDRAAVAGLSMSNPLPPLPSDYKGFQVRLAFTFAYNMPAK